MKRLVKNNGIVAHRAILALVLTVFALFDVPLGSAAPDPVTVEGVDFKREIRVNNSILALRGYGLLRYMVFIKAYVAAFYLPESIPSEDALSDVPKHLEIEYFHPITAQDFAKATTSSISRNVSLRSFQRLQPKAEEFNNLYRDVKPGDRYTLTYVPGKGTTLSWNGQPLGTVSGEDFAVGLFSIWIGPNPLDGDFKRILLGG
jgi:hypothetical protein